MIKRSVFLLLILLSGVSFISSSRSSPIKKPEIIDNSKYILCVPEGIDISKKYPLVVALSPSADAESMIKTWQDVSNKYKWIIFASKENRNEINLIEFIPELATLIEEISSEFPVDRSKIIATGLSGGGMSAHAFCFSYPKLISAVVVNTGITHEYYRERINEYPRGKLVVFLASPTDFRYEEMKRDRDFLENLGWKVKWVEFKGGHKIAPSSAYEETAEWLQGQF